MPFSTNPDQICMFVLSRTKLAKSFNRRNSLWHRSRFLEVPQKQIKFQVKLDEKQHQQLIRQQCRFYDWNFTAPSRSGEIYARTFSFEVIYSSLTYAITTKDTRGLLLDACFKFIPRQCTLPSVVPLLSNSPPKPTDLINAHYFSFN